MSDSSDCSCILSCLVMTLVACVVVFFEEAFPKHQLFLNLASPLRYSYVPVS